MISLGGYEMHSVTEVMIAVFLLILSGLGTVATRILARLSVSVNRLNERVAVIVERSEWHDRALEDHGLRLKSLEKGE